MNLKKRLYHTNNCKDTPHCWIYISGKKFAGTLSHAPCINNCKAILELSMEDARIRELGRKIRQTYVDEGRRIDKPQVGITNNKFDIYIQKLVLLKVI